MKVYIAAPYRQKELARTVARSLEALQHDIVSFWHEQIDPVPEDLHPTLARADIAAVKNCDLLFCLNPDDSTTGALHLEAGVAQAAGKAVICIQSEYSKNLLLRQHEHFLTKPRGADFIRVFTEPYRKDFYADIDTINELKKKLEETKHEVKALKNIGDGLLHELEACKKASPAPTKAPAKKKARGK